MRTTSRSQRLLHGTYARLYAVIVMIMVAVMLVRYHTLLETEREEAQLRMRAEVQAVSYVLLQALDLLPGDSLQAADRLHQAAQRHASAVQSLRWEVELRNAQEVRTSPPSVSAPAWFARLLDLQTPQWTVPLRTEGGSAGQLTVMPWPQPYTDRAWNAMVTQSRITALNAFTVLLLLTLMLRANDRMLTRMREATERFRQGHLDTRMPLKGTPEAREIADTFNDMACKVQALVLSLQETQRQQSEQLHFRRQLVNALPLPLFVLNGRGARLETNRAWRELLNASQPSSVAGTLDQLWADGVDSSAALALRLSTLPSGSQVTVRPLQGEPRDMACYHASFTAPDGVPAGTIGVLVDVTEHSLAIPSARAAQTHAETALASMSEGVITTDLEGRVVTLNPTAQRLTGCASEQAAGRHVSEVFRLDPPCPVLPLAPRSTATAPDTAPAPVLVHRSGERLGVNYSVAPMREPQGRTVGYVLVFRSTPTGEQP